MVLPRAEHMPLGGFCYGIQVVPSGDRPFEHIPVLPTEVSPKETVITESETLTFPFPILERYSKSQPIWMTQNLNLKGPNGKYLKEYMTGLLQ